MESTVVSHLQSMRFILTIICVLWLGNCFSQVRVEVIVLSNEDQSPVTFANIFNSENDYLGRTNDQGVATIESELGASILISHIKFEDGSFTIKEDKRKYKIGLDQGTKQLDTAIVVPDPLPEVVYSNENYHVADYLFVEDGILILSYTKKRLFKSEEEVHLDILDECHVIKLNRNLEVQSKSVFKTDGLELIKDEEEQCFLRTKTAYYFISEEDHGLMLSKLPPEFEMNQNATVKLTNESGEEISVVNNYDVTFPSFDYFLGNPEHPDELKFLCTVEDEVLMHTFRAQYRNLLPRQKLEAYRMELSTGIDREIISGYMTGYHKSIYFKPLYAPAFTQNNELFIFDHLNNEIKVFNSEGTLIETFDIEYHKNERKSGWKNQLVQDEAAQNIYAVFQKNSKTFLKQINTSSGEALGAFELTYKYLEQIQVRNGFAFYLYRPHSSAQKLYLYKESIQ